ncbi:MAG TPA: transcriptional regulator [Gammaproteobacteria bacterium]|nr:transcriptional regulator [Gammaproteobacteria bacterium]
MKKQKVTGSEAVRDPRSACPITQTLDIIGDRWTLLVIRDLFMGKETYGQLLDSPEGIPTNILADRLKRLERHGIVSRQPYQERPVRYAYRLTEKGQALGTALTAVIQWGLTWLPGTRLPSQIVLREDGKVTLAPKE